MQNFKNYYCDDLLIYTPSVNTHSLILNSYTNQARKKCAKYDHHEHAPLFTIIFLVKHYITKLNPRK